MRRLITVAVLLFAAAAFAQHEEPTKPAEKEDTAAAILHHVADSDEYEFDIPLNEGKNPTFHLPRIRIPLKAGACEVESNDLVQGCLDLSITKHVVMMWLASLLLILSFVFGAHRSKTDLVPHGASANMLEVLVLFVRNELAIPNIGPEEGPRFTPYLLSVFFFILFCNLLGLFPWMATPTGNISVTCGLAICTFLLTELGSIRAGGLKAYLHHLLGGAPAGLAWLMIPIEIVGKFTKPFALTMRLFANMLAGHIVLFSLLGLIFIIGNAWVSVAAVPFAAAIYFLEIFVAFVQAYIFAMLSAVFIGMGVSIGHHGHDENAHGAEMQHGIEAAHAEKAHAAH